jgi:hypothetical protein
MRRKLVEVECKALEHPAEPFDHRRVYNAARYAAIRVCPTDQVNWREDITQEIVLRIWQLHQEGIIVGRRIYRQFAIRAMVGICGDERNPGSLGYRRPELVDPDVLAGLSFVDRRETAPLTALIRKRLEERWDLLSEKQRVGLRMVVTGEFPSEVAAELGLTGGPDATSQVCGARRVALAKLALPLGAKVPKTRPRDEDAPRRGKLRGRRPRTQPRKEVRQ